MMRYDRAGLLERLTSNTLFTVLLGIAATVLVPVILYSFTQFTQCVLLGIMLIGAVPWEILGMLLLPIGGMVGYVGLFQARRPATSSADYWATLTCLGVGIAAAGTVIGELLTIDIGLSSGRRLHRRPLVADRCGSRPHRALAAPARCRAGDLTLSRCTYICSKGEKP
jgi:hypothetical protein